MRSTFKVLFYLKKNNLNKHGEAPIMARITIDGAIAQFSCKAFILPDLWETKFNRAVGRSEKAVEINRLLDEIKSGVDSVLVQAGNGERHRLSASRCSGLDRLNIGSIFAYQREKMYDILMGGGLIRILITNLDFPAISYSFSFYADGFAEACRCKDMRIDNQNFFFRFCKIAFHHLLKTIGIINQIDFIGFILSG